LSEQKKQLQIKEKQRQIRKKHIESEMKKVSEGKKPYYLKRSELRKQEMIEKYQTLKGQGKLDRYIIKKRRRQVAKDRKSIPNRRRNN